MPWFVLYTKSRNEKLVAEQLRKRGIEVYCPLLKTARRWSDRTKVVEEPLFKSYCFVKLEEHERAQVFGVQGVVRYLFWLKKPAIVREEEIAAIKKMLNEVPHECIKVTQFQVGDVLKIDSGSFAEQSGVVLRQQGNLVTLKLESLQMMLTVDVSKTMTVVV